MVLLICLHNTWHRFSTFTRTGKTPCAVRFVITSIPFIPHALVITEVIIRPIAGLTKVNGQDVIKGLVFSYRIIRCSFQFFPDFAQVVHNLKHRFFLFNSYNIMTANSRRGSHLHYPYPFSDEWNELRKFSVQLAPSLQSSPFYVMPVLLWISLISPTWRFSAVGQTTPKQAMQGISLRYLRQGHIIDERRYALHSLHRRSLMLLITGLSKARP